MQSTAYPPSKNSGSGGVILCHVAHLIQCIFCMIMMRNMHQYGRLIVVAQEAMCASTSHAARTITLNNRL
jgi:hypothetical protein